MKYIIDFYKELDMLNLIIFWGIIIVIILLLIFSMILINKNKKLKRLVDKQNTYEEDLPIIKQEEIITENSIQTEEIKQEDPGQIRSEKDFIAEEHVIEYKQEEIEISNIEQEEIKETINEINSIEIPNVPYQRNVLREMSLSQTSPIGINRQTDYINKKIEIAKDLNNSLNEKEYEEELYIPENEIKEDLKNIESSPRKTEIILKESEILDENYPEIANDNENDNKDYLEEVSRKLSEAEIPDEIERTNYELKQEEDAIISYKELMEKKDSIQTIDEEDAIISIEELMNRNKNKEESEDIAKLYNLTEDEENDDFIKELKQFRNDL